MSLDRPRRVLVTGASGFIGRHLLARLLRHGHEVHGTCATAAEEPGLTRVDLGDARSLRRLVRRTAPEVVLHLGGFTSVADSWDHLDDCLQANVQGTLSLLQALSDCGWPADRVVYVSSSEVYGEAPGALPGGRPGQPGLAVLRQQAGRGALLPDAVPRQAVAGGAALLACPSYGEAFGLVVAEALACGTPVVVAPGSGPAELVGDAPVGVVDDDVARGIARLLAAPPDPAGCVARARLWDWDLTVGPQHLAAYDAVRQEAGAAA